MRTGSTNDTDAKKRRKARSGHSKRASARPSAKADKGPTKKERGMEWVSDSDGASNRGTHARHGPDPGKGRNPERAQNSRRLLAAVRTKRKMPLHPQGAKRSLRQRLEGPPGRIKG